MKVSFTVAREPTTWRLDELAHAGPEHLDSEYLAAYDHKSPTDWSEDVAALAANAEGDEARYVRARRGHYRIKTSRVV